MPEATRSFSWRTLLALVLVPVLVAGGFLWGTWNAGDRLHKVEAAVVNLDEGVTLDDQFIPLGRQLSADLVDSSKEQNFTWVLADAAHAWPGLASGRYAAVVVIPENFSAAATSYGNDDPLTAEQATIAVHTSPVAGVADGLLGNVLANAASRTLNATLTEAYLDRIYIGFNDTGEQFETVADAAGKLADGLDKLNDGSPALVDGVQQVETGAGALASGLQTMKTRTASLPSDGRKLAAGVKQYVAGANQLADQLAEAGKGTVTLAANLSQLAGGLQAFQQSMAAASTDPTSLGIECPYQTQAECAAFYRGVGTGTGAAAQGVSQLAGGLSALSEGLNEQLPTKAEQAKQAKQLAAFKAGGKKLVTGSATLGTGLGQLSAGIAQVADGADKLAGGLPQLTSGVEQYTGGVGKIADGTRKLADGLAEGADKVPSYSEAERENLAQVVAAPVSTTGLDGVVTPTVSWASLLIALALWLGALATFAVVKPLDARLALSTASTPTLLWRALLPGVIVAAGQAIVLTAIGTAVLGLGWQEAAELAGFLLLAGMAFVLVNHSLAAWMGNAGRLISIAFAVITTVTAVTSAVPAVFDSLRPLSPLSPALDGLRALLTDSAGAPTAVFTLVGWALVGLAASALAVLRRRTVRLSEVSALA